MSLQPYDLIMLAVLLVATVRGAWKGMAWQIAAMASFGASFFVASKYADSVAGYISADAPWNKFLAMLVLYLGTSLVIWWLFAVVSTTIERVRLREFDRQVGGLFGAAKGVLYCCLITFFVVTLSRPGREFVLRSESGRHMATLIHWATPIMPAEVRDVLGPYLQQLDRGLDPRASGPT